MGINAPPPGSTTTLQDTWVAIHEAAALVATIAGVAEGRITTEIELGLCADLRHAEMHDQAVRDLANVLRRGVSALLEAHVSGGAPHAASLTLWQDFLVERSMLLHSACHSHMPDIDL